MFRKTPAPPEPLQLPLFGDLGVDVEALRMERAAIAAARRSAATQLAHAKCWNRISTPGTAAISAILSGATSLGAVYPNPAPQGGEVREVLAGIGRRLGTAARHAKAALSADELRRMVGAIDGRGHRGGV